MGASLSSHQVLEGARLMRACRKADDALVAQMLQNKDLVLWTSWRTGYTPLHYAAKHGSLQTVKLLLLSLEQRVLQQQQQEAEPGSTQKSSGSGGTLAAVATAIAAALNCQDRRGMTPLHHAARHGHAELVSYLLDQGANALLQDDTHKRTPLHWAAISDQAECVRALLEHAREAGGKPLAEELMRDGVVGEIRFVDARTDRGFTALHLAAWYGFTRVAQALLQGGASITRAAANSAVNEDMTCDEGSAVLHIAALRRRHSIIVLVMEAYAARMAAQNAELTGDGRYSWEGQPHLDPRLQRTREGHTPAMVALDVAARMTAGLLSHHMRVTRMLPDRSNWESYRVGVPKLQVLAAQALHGHLCSWVVRYQSEQQQPDQQEPGTAKESAVFADDLSCELPATIDAPHLHDLKGIGHLSDCTDMISAASTPLFRISRCSTQPSLQEQCPAHKHEELDECGVCLDAMPGVQLLPCQHVVCGTCLSGILHSERRPAQCPFCRGVIGGLERV